MSGTLLGSTLPRIWTRPNVTGPAGPCGCGCALTPDTSVGFAVVEFAEFIGRPLDPWQRWLVIHALELRPDGLPRFRQVLVLVARQNGKTELLVVLSLFWMFVERVPLVLGTSTKLDYAQESWKKAIRLAKRCRDLLELLPNTPTRGVRSANGEQTFETIEFPETGEPSRYKIAASNEEGGRSLTVHRLVEDELRQHRDWSAHEAAENAMNAVVDAQAWAISNMGDDRSVVLNSLRDSALEHMATGDGDDRLGLFEWSSPAKSQPTDLAALAQANPNLGRRIDPDAILGKARRAQEQGGEQLTRFLTEVMCQHVPSMEPSPIDPDAWDALADRAARVTRARPVFAVDVAPDRRSAAIARAGTQPDGRPQVGLVEHRPGTDWVAARVRQLRDRHSPAAVVIDPGSPAGSLIPDLEAAGVEVTKMSARDMAAACGLLADAVRDRRVVHLGDPILSAAFRAAKSRPIGDGGWGWARRTSDGDICPLVAVTEALWGLTAVPAVDVEVRSLDEPDEPEPDGPDDLDDLDDDAGDPGDPGRLDKDAPAEVPSGDREPAVISLDHVPDDEEDPDAAAAWWNEHI